MINEDIPEDGLLPLSKYSRPYLLLLLFRYIPYKY